MFVYRACVPPQVRVGNVTGKGADGLLVLCSDAALESGVAGVIEARTVRCAVIDCALLFCCVTSVSAVELLLLRYVADLMLCRLCEYMHSQGMLLGCC